MRKAIIGLLALAAPLTLGACFSTDLQNASDPNTQAICFPIVGGVIQYDQGVRTTKQSALGQGWDTSTDVFCDILVGTQAQQQRVSAAQAVLDASR